MDAYAHSTAIALARAEAAEIAAEAAEDWDALEGPSDEDRDGDPDEDGWAAEQDRFTYWED